MVFRKKRWWGGITKRPSQEATETLFNDDSSVNDNLVEDTSESTEFDKSARQHTSSEPLLNDDTKTSANLGHQESDDYEESDDASNDYENDEPIEESLDQLEQIHDDPLGEAYDLDKGDVLSNQEEERPQPWRNKMASPKEFFSTEILYRYDILEDVDRDLVKGKYRIELKGFQGGVWTVDLSEQVEVMNRAEDADVIFTMQQRDFLDLINGSLNPQLAMLSKKIRVSGDVKRAIHFQSLLAPSYD